MFPWRNEKNVDTFPGAICIFLTLLLCEYPCTCSDFRTRLSLLRNYGVSVLRVNSTTCTVDHIHVGIREKKLCSH